jgi:serine phosphatase RsbU (regulator of sigma subunit)
MTVPTEPSSLVPTTFVDDELRTRALRARRAASVGLVRAGCQAVHSVLLEPRARRDAVLLVACGEVLRRASAWTEAAAVFDDAWRALEDRRGEDAACLLALAVDSRATAGDLEGGRMLIEAAMDAGADVHMARAHLELLRGRVAEARQIEREISNPTTSAFAKVQTDLLRAEILTEIGAVAGVLQVLTRLDPLMKGEQRFEEVALRTRLIAATSLLQQQEGLTGDARTELQQQARRAIRSLERYARSFPLYRAWASELAGELALLRGEDGHRDFAQAAAVLEREGAVFVRARLLGRQALYERRERERRLGAKEGEARRLLFDLGAGARLAPIASAAPATTSSMMARRSIAMRLEAAQLNDETGLEAVVEVTRHLAQIRDLTTLFERILDAVVRVLHADRGVLLECGEGDVLRCVAARGLDPAAVVEGAREISFGVIRESMKTGEAVLSDNALSDARFRERQSVMATDIRSVLVAPIRTQKRTLGYAYLDRRMVDVPFDADHQELLAVFATQVAVAWENTLAFEEIGQLNRGLEQKVKERTVELREKNQALLESIDELTNTRLKLAEATRDALEKEMSLARDIQNSILPPRTRIATPGLAFVGRVDPASFCGGDFWGYVVTAAGDTVLVVADVTGHGVASSLITAVARASLDTLAKLIDVESPARVLSILNEAIHGAAHGELCATAFCALIQPRRNRLLFANAGHPFPFVIEQRGVAVLSGAGVRLGESLDVRYEQAERAFAPGTKLVLYSDGIVEWMNEKRREYGARRLQKALSAAPIGEDVERLCSSVLEDVTGFANGQERDDDLTIVVVERTSE